MSDDENDYESMDDESVEEDEVKELNAAGKKKNFVFVEMAGRNLIMFSIVSWSFVLHIASHALSYMGYNRDA